MKKYISLFFTFIVGFMSIDIVYSILCKKFDPATAAAIVGYSMILTVIWLVIEKFRRK